MHTAPQRHLLNLLQRALQVLLGGIVLISLSACELGQYSLSQALLKQKRSSEATTKPPLASPLRSNETTRDITQHYAYRAHTSCTLAAADAQRLHRRISALLDKGQSKELGLSQEAWMRSFQSLQACLSYQPLDSARPLFGSLLYRLDPWPISPGFVDAVEDYPLGGLINSLQTPISSASLLAMHGHTDATEASLGSTVIEFLLFNQGAPRHVDAFKLIDDEAMLAVKRRRDYLLKISEIYQQDLLTLAALWEPQYGAWATAVRAAAAPARKGEIFNNISRHLEDLHRGVEHDTDRASHLRLRYALGETVDLVNSLEQQAPMASQVELRNLQQHLSTLADAYRG